MGLIPGLPESETVTGSTFLLASYGYLLLQGANLISDGSELLLEVLDPGIIGGLVLPILGAVPDAAIILMSGLGGTVEEAQEQVAVGMGTLAGSTIMLLTIAWAGSIYLGRCDLVADSRGNLIAKDKTLGKYNSPWDWRKTGVTTDAATRENTYPMLLSSFLFLIIQIPAFAGYVEDTAAAYTALFLSFFALAIYCVYQVISPELQERKMQKARANMMKHHAVNAMAGLAGEHGHVLLCSETGALSIEATRAIFEKFDSDGSGELDTQEVKGLLVGLTLGMENLELNSADADAWFRELDKDKSGTVSFEEFYHCLDLWVKQKHSSSTSPIHSAHPPRQHGAEQEGAYTPLQDLEDGQGEEEEEDGEDDDDEEEEEIQLTRTEIYTQAVGKLLMGTFIIVLFADPMVESVSSFAKATNLPAFFVSFVITPFASNASELVSSLQFAAKKKRKNISLTYCQVYGAVTMNNTMCFGVFMSLVAARGLKWEFSSEVVTMLLAIWIMAFVGSRGVTFQLWMAPVVLLIYPLSLALICFCDFVLGWH
eukprot:CAMPEP_0196588338 /NCGR_PEP_ID=MMETSP1081-20130531/60283_1 /TAXON_ID=36882 /ORGANISM="Pyramimonas amylifera, Strain CCMP720" /LENGTH=539 /DNA_ID=CAMNT_0041910809 /DNA_START=20 /DNA_END=1639 /DNA_ORIENTATION=+